MEKMVVDLLSQFEHGKISRRQLVQNLTLGVMAAAVSTQALAQGKAKAKSFRAINVNHISYASKDYGRTRDFYAELLGMKVSEDNGKQCYLTFGDTVLIPRQARPGTSAPVVDHVAYSIEGWDREQVKEELTRRGLDPKPDYQGSFIIKDPDGYALQISAKEFMTMAE